MDGVGGLDGKIFGPRSVCHDRVPNIFCPARPNSVNQNFIIILFMTTALFLFFFFGGGRGGGGVIKFPYVAHFDRKVGIYIETVVLVCISHALLIKSRMRAECDLSRARRLFPALLTPSPTALIQGFSK